jgi:hypothetical protein
VNDQFYDWVDEQNRLHLGVWRWALRCPMPGTIETGQPTSNVAWGEDGQTLFITGGSSVYRLRLTTGADRY